VNADMVHQPDKHSEATPNVPQPPESAAPTPLPRLLITAGPTYEPIDDVRFIGNRSSGRLGLAIAQAAARRGQPTTLLLGPIAAVADLHSSIRLLRFRTTADLQALLIQEWPNHDLLLMAAAVADYRVAGGPSAGKLARSVDFLTLTLEPTPDVLAALVPITKPEQTLIGFALEPEETLESRAKEKLRRKGLHAIIANPLETMDSETITGTLITSGGRSLTPGRDVGKDEFATWLLNQVNGLRRDPRV
jgi:phosphopantothenoylcysteine decarboxylase / phosphopantothenate---cysteine ligase